MHEGCTHRHGRYNLRCVKRGVDRDFFFLLGFDNALVLSIEILILLLKSHIYQSIIILGVLVATQAVVMNIRTYSLSVV